MKAKVKGLKMDVRNEKGFTLLEVLVAGFILTIGLLGIAGMMTSAIRGNDFGKRMTAAENLAQQRLEEFKNLSYSFAKALLYNSYGTKTIPICGTDADPPDSDIDDEDDDDIDDEDDNPLSYEAYELEDYGVIKDIQNPAITYPAYRRETLVEAVNGCPNTDLTANVTVMVKWKGVTGEHKVTFMTMLAK